MCAPETKSDLNLYGFVRPTFWIDYILTGHAQKGHTNSVGRRGVGGEPPEVVEFQTSHSESEFKSLWAIL